MGSPSSVSKGKMVATPVAVNNTPRVSWAAVYQRVFLPLRRFSGW